MDFYKYLEQENIEYSVEDGAVTVFGSLYLEGANITSLPDSLTVGGNLYLRGANVTSLPDSLTVGGNLYLEGTNITSLPDSLTVGGSLYLEGANITSLPDSLTVGGSLYLRGANITSLPDSLTVGGSLDLEGTDITTLPPNLTVGGSLDLEGTDITTLPDNLTVGGNLYHGCTKIRNLKHYSTDVEAALYKKGMTYADGILAHVISRKGNIAKIKIVGKKETSFLVTSDDGKHHAHGKTAKEALTELAFKMADRTDLSRFENTPLDTVKTPEEWGNVYRIITGACKIGVDNFKSQNKLKESYTLAEIIEATKGRFGHDKFVATVK